MKGEEVKPKKIRLNEKDLLQLGSDLYIFKEGEGMCQNGAITLLQLIDFGEENRVRFHESDIPNIIKVLKNKIPTMTESNCSKFHENIREMWE